MLTLAFFLLRSLPSPFLCLYIYLPPYLSSRSLYHTSPHLQTGLWTHTLSEMPPPETHPQAIFTLRPLNDRADTVVADIQNQHLVSCIPNRGSQLGLDIGHVPSARNDGVTLATMGRMGDVRMQGSAVARIQCAF